MVFIIIQQIEGFLKHCKNDYNAVEIMFLEGGTVQMKQVIKNQLVFNRSRPPAKKENRVEGVVGMPSHYLTCQARPGQGMSGHFRPHSLGLLLGSLKEWSFVSVIFSQKLYMARLKKNPLYLPHIQIFGVPLSSQNCNFNIFVVLFKSCGHHTKL